MTARTQTHLIGHENIEKELLNSWKSGRLSHSILLTGPKGVGRATLAFRLAKFLFSNPDPSVNSLATDPESAVSRRVISGGHGDLLVIEPDPEKATKEIAVDQVRSIKRFLSQTPLEGGWRIVIVDGEMNGTAANAILKVLEEPPKKSLLILLSETAGRVLPTIRSRCQMIKMKPLNEKQVAQVIKREQPRLDEEEVKVLAALCEGRPGLALAYYEAEAVEMYQDLLTLLKSLSSFDYEAALEFSKKYSSKGESRADLNTFQVVGDCFKRFISKLSCYALLQDTASTLPEEIEAFQHALTIRPIEEWAKLWETINTSFAKAHRFHLDKSQVMFCRLSDLSGV